MGFLEVLGVALRLGLTSFGGPAAHLGYYRAEYVQRRRWLTDEELAELVAVAQFLPGPSSSQVGAAIGHGRAGWPGALGAWLGFTAPSALLMAGFAAVAARVDVTGTVWLQALKLVAVAVVADAVLSLATALTRTRLTVTLALAVAVTVLMLPPGAPVQLVALAAAGAVTLALRAEPPVRPATGASSAPATRASSGPATDVTTGAEAAPLPDKGSDGSARPVRRGAGAALLGAFAGLFALVVAVRPLLDPHPVAALAAAMYRSGSLVFGGGHVVLPLLQAETVPRLVPADDFLAGYGAAQAMPGPLFSFGTFLGQAAAGVPGALVATAAIFLPGMLLMFGVLPFWQALRGRPKVRAALVGVNAAVVGLLAAALVDPIGSSALHGLPDLLFAAALFALLRFAHWRPLLVVAAALAASPLLSLT
jgi:chromate transporter